MADKDLEARVQALEDIEAIKKLIAKYCYFMDAGLKDPGSMQKVVKLFAKDATVDFPGVGSGKGIPEITNFYTKAFASPRTFTMHMIHSPLIEVKGNSGTGEWYVQVASTIREGNRAYWTGGKYENEFVKEGNEWKFKSITWKGFFRTPYEESWAGKG